MKRKIASLFLLFALLFLNAGNTYSQKSKAADPKMDWWW